MSRGSAAINLTSTEGPFSLAGMTQRLIRQGQSFSGHERHCCFLNTAQRRFADISAASGIDFPDDGRAVAVVDWDQDGDLDLWIANRSGPQVRFLRNNTPSDHHHLSVRLIGKTSNRDAIGARVELYVRGHHSEVREQTSDPATLDPRHLRLIKTVRAGEGFLAQSSKWVHFGLGQSTAIDRLVIRWPGGETETVRGLETDHRYEVVEGTGEARPWSGPTRKVELEPSRLTSSPPDDLAHVRLARPVPLPRLRYITLDGQEADSYSHLGGPVLLNVWASWCRPCLSELAEFAQRSAEIRAAGLQIVALSVDGLGEDGEHGPLAAQQALSKLDFRFPAGMAKMQLVDLLDIVHNFVFDHYQRLPVPTSLLVDDRGYLAAIYKGPVSVDRLLSDVEKLPLDDDPFGTQSLPFSGRTLTPPGNPELASFAGHLITSGFVDEGLEYVERYEQHLSGIPGYAELLVTMGAHLVMRDEPESAESLYRKALAQDSELARAHLNLGSVLGMLGERDEGISHFREALRIDPNYGAAHQNLGRALMFTGQVQEAGQSFFQAVKHRPADASAYYDLGIWLESEGELDQAMDRFRETIRLEPEHIKAHVKLGAALGTQRKIQEAVGHLREALRLQPDDADAHMNLGVALGMQRKFGEAVGHLRQAVRLQPQSAKAHNNLGFALCALDKIDEGMGHYRKALEIDPQNLDAHINMGIGLMRLRQVVQAKIHFRQAIDIAPERPDGYFNLAKVHQSQGQQAEAIGLYQEVVRIDSTHAVAHNNLAAALERGGRTEEAIKHYQQALRIHPNFATARQNLNRLLDRKTDAKSE